MPKFTLTPSTRVLFLGFIPDYHQGWTQLPGGKLTAVIKDLQRLSVAKEAILRRCSSVLGTITVLLFALPQMRLFTDSLRTHITYVTAHLDWEAWVLIPISVQEQLTKALTELQSCRGRNLLVKMQDSFEAEASLQGSGRCASRTSSNVGLVLQGQRPHKNQGLSGDNIQQEELPAEKHQPARSLIDSWHQTVCSQPSTAKSQEALAQSAGKNPE